MSNKIKGGKADKLSIEDIANKHDISVDSIKTQIEMGKKVEMEHVDDVDLAEEIAMDHLEEIPDYYTRLKKMEKDAKKELNTEAQRYMALAGIKEGDKKFLKNESFTEGIMHEEAPENKNDNEENFIVIEFDQKEIEPGQDDDQLYKLG